MGGEQKGALKERFLQFMRRGEAAEKARYALLSIHDALKLVAAIATGKSQLSFLKWWNKTSPFRVRLL